jgi:hypothetical protein
MAEDLELARQGSGQVWLGSDKLTSPTFSMIGALTTCISTDLVTVAYTNELEAWVSSSRLRW